jgi:hypothetical protein
VSGTDPAGARRPLELAPFRGLRFDPGTIGDLGTAVAPPYDVLDAELVRTLESANPRNIVRLILSRRFETPYLAVLERLDRWRAEGALRPDPRPALYLYEYTAEATLVRGLVGLVGLRDPAERVVLPHEQVNAGPVEDRVALMRTTRTNLEPILLLHDGTTWLRALLGSTAAGPPATEVVAYDGTRHRLWLLDDAAVLTRVARELAPGQALIADGHHRYAAYLRLQADAAHAAHAAHAADAAGTAGLRATAGTAGSASPWDHGLAMLVDHQAFPLRVNAIHRTVDGLTGSDVVDLTAHHGQRLEAVGSQREALALLDAAASEKPAQVATFALTDGLAWWMLAVPRTDAVDTTVLHRDVLPAWHVTEEQLGYHHALHQALHFLAQRPGIAVVMAPPTVEQVLRSAAAGVTLPRKSTSFEPKPQMGLVMRDLRDR